MKKSEKGQGLIEYALILVLIAVIVIVLLALLSGCVWLLLLPFGIAAWPWIVAHGTALVTGLQAGNPTAIFIAAVIVIVLLFLVFRPRR